MTIPTVQSAQQTVYAMSLETTPGTMSTADYYGWLQDSGGGRFNPRNYDPQGKLGGGLTHRGEAVRTGYAPNGRGRSTATLQNAIMLAAMAGCVITYPDTDTGPLYHYSIGSPTGNDQGVYGTIIQKDAEGIIAYVGSRLMTWNTTISAGGVVMFDWSWESISVQNGPSSPTIHLDASEKAAISAMGGAPTVMGVSALTYDQITLQLNVGLDTGRFGIGALPRYALPRLRWAAGGAWRAPFSRSRYNSIFFNGGTSASPVIPTGALSFTLADPSNTYSLAVATTGSKTQWLDATDDRNQDNTVMHDGSFRINDGEITLTWVTDVPPAAIGATEVSS